MFGVQVLPASADSPAVIYCGQGWPCGGYEVCRECYLKLYPDSGPAAWRAPRDSGDVHSTRPDVLNQYFCAACKRYAREDDPFATQNACLRLTREVLLCPEDVARLAGAPDVVARDFCDGRRGVRPGGLRMCRECWAEWSPVVARRLVREGVLPPGSPVEVLGYNVV